MRLLMIGMLTIAALLLASGCGDGKKPVSGPAFACGKNFTVQPSGEVFDSGGHQIAPGHYSVALKPTGPHTPIACEYAVVPGFVYETGYPISN